MKGIIASYLPAEYYHICSINEREGERERGC